jgi:hypothetical protein
MVGALDFIVVLVILYVLECFRKVCPDELVFDRRIFRYTIRKPILYPSNGEWGWLILNPFRPDGPIFALTPPRYALTSFGVLTMCEGDDEFTLLPVDSLTSMIGDSTVSLKNLGIEGRPLVGIDELLRASRQLFEARPEQRTERLRSLRAEPFNTENIEQACSILRSQSSTLRSVSMSLFLVCFVVFPCLVSLIGLNASLLWLFPVVVLFAIVVVVYYHRAARVLMPALPKVDLYGNMAKLLLYPISTLRSTELLSYHFLKDYDPIAVAAVLCTKEDAARLAVTEMVNLQYASGPSAGDSICTALKEHRQSRLALIQSFCAQQNISIDFWNSPPNPESKDSLTYCPACGVQYRLSEGVCVDCKNILLQPLKMVREKETTVKRQGPGR